MTGPETVNSDPVGVETRDKRHRSSGPTVPDEGSIPVCQVTAVELKIAGSVTRTAKTRKTRADQREMEIEVCELLKYENRGNILNRGVTCMLAHETPWYQ